MSTSDIIQPRAEGAALAMPRFTPRYTAFEYCRLFFAFVLAAMLVAEMHSVSVGLPPYHRHMSWSDIPFGLIVFGIPFVAAAKPRTQRDWMNVVAAALILPLANSVMPWVTEETIYALPQTFDRQVVALDAPLGINPSFVVGEYFTHHPLLRQICFGMYAAVAFPSALVAAIEAQSGRRRGPGALPIFLVIAGAGFILYHWLPVIGPAAYFETAFPFPRTSTIYNTARNAMPSLHTAWVLMAFLTTRGMSLPIRLTTAIIAIGTMIATLGSGEHYLTDLVVSCPFVLTIRALCAIELPWTASDRGGSIFIGAALVLVWGLAVRGAIEPSAIYGLVPAAMVATVVVSAWCERRLAQAEALHDGWAIQRQTPPPDPAPPPRTKRMTNPLPPIS